MLYFKALTEGCRRCRRPTRRCGRALDRRAAAAGWPALHAELARVDPATAARLAPTDAQRIQRALEVHALTGRPLSALQGARQADDALGPTIAHWRCCPPTARALHAAIAERFDLHARCRAWSTSCAALRQRYALDARRCPRCAASAIARRGSSSTAPSTPRACASMASPRRASSRKRQLTWLRATPAVAFDAGAPDARATPYAALRRAAMRACGATLTAPLRRHAIITVRIDLSASSGAPGHDRTHALRQALGQPRRPHRGRRHGAALHRPPPRARGDEPAGVRGPQARRPQAVAHAIDRRDGRPQHADQGLGRGIRDPISRTQVETLDANIRAHRRQGLLPVPRPAAGHRPRHRPRAGRDAAGHDGRLRRLAHQHPRRVRRARVRHRHLRGRARAGHAVPAREEGEVDADPRRRPAAPRCHGQGPGARDHRPHRHRGRHRPRDRVRRRARCARCRWKAG